MMREEAEWLKEVKRLSLVYRVSMPGDDRENRPARGTPEYKEYRKKYDAFRDNLRSRLHRHGEECWCTDGYFFIDCTPMLFKCLEEIHLPLLQTFSREYDSALGIGIFPGTIGGQVRPVFIHRDFLLKEELKELDFQISDYPTWEMDWENVSGFLETFPTVSYRLFPMSREEIERQEEGRTQYSLCLRKGPVDPEKNGPGVSEDGGNLVFRYEGELGEEFGACVKTWIPRIEADVQANRERIESRVGDWRIEFHKLFTTMEGTYSFRAESCLRPILDLLGASGIFFYFEPMWTDEEDLQALTVTEKAPSEVPITASPSEREKLENDEKRLAMVREIHFYLMAEMPGYDREDHEEPTEEYEQFLKDLDTRVYLDQDRSSSEEIFLTDCSNAITEMMGYLNIPALVEVAHEYDSWINLSVYSETVGARVQPVFIAREFFYRPELDRLEVALENWESYDLKRGSFLTCIEADPHVCVHQFPLPMAELEEWTECEWQCTLYLRKTRPGQKGDNSISQTENENLAFHYSGEIMEPMDACFKSWMPRITEDLNANRERLEKQEGEWRVECHVAFTTPNGICGFYAKSSFRPLLDLLAAPGVFFYFEPIWLDRENQLARRVTCREGR